MTEGDHNVTSMSNGSGKKPGKNGHGATAAPSDGEPPAKEKEKRKSAKEKLDIHVAFADAMASDATGRKPTALRGFKPRFRVIEDPAKKKRPVEVLKDDVVAEIDREGVEKEILRFSHIDLAQLNLKLAPRDTADVYRLWADSEEPLREEDISPVRELSEAGYCWHRLPWDIKDDAAPTPTFDEMMSRCGNSTALMAWIGSLLDAESGRHQYLYLHGEGGNGKGRLAAFLAAVFGRAYRAEYVSGKPNQFWTSGLIGARLVCFPDFEDPGFPNTGFFKSLTGGDAVRVENKGMKSFTTELCCKFLFLSNSAPELNESPANRRRAIYCRMEEVPVEKRIAPTAYSALLWREGPTWLARCKELYKKTATGSDFIPTNDDSLSEVIDAHEETIVDLVERWFLVSEELDTDPGHMQALLRKEGLRDPRLQRAFFAILGRRYGVTKVQKRGTGDERHNRRRAYRGVGVRPGLVAGLVGDK